VLGIIVTGMGPAGRWGQGEPCWHGDGG
jgi:hypothetical protein